MAPLQHERLLNDKVPSYRFGRAFGWFLEASNALLFFTVPGAAFGWGLVHFKILAYFASWLVTFTLLI